MARANKLQMINVEMEVDSISQYLWSVFCFLSFFGISLIVAIWK